MLQAAREEPAAEVELDLDDAHGLTDLLVTDEGHWISSRRPELMRVWKGLKALTNMHMPGDESVLGDASFGIFASFMYRWTSTERDSDSSAASTPRTSSG